MPEVKSVRNDIFDQWKTNIYRRIFKSDSWDEFTEALENARLDGLSKITKADFEATFLTHLGYSSYHSFLFRNDFYHTYNSIHPQVAWTPGAGIPPDEIFFRSAIRSGTKPHDILTSPHLKMDPDHPTFQRIVKVVLSDPTRVSENLSSVQAVLGVWRASKAFSGATNKETFRKYIIRHLKKGRKIETPQDLTATIEESPFLSTVFRSAKEDAMLKTMLERIIENLFSSLRL